MIRLSGKAERQFADLLRHFAKRQRPEARQALVRALQNARASIEAMPSAGFSAPRPYRDLAQPGQAWIKSGRYWLAYSLTDPPVIVALFHDTADIPGRL